VAKMRLRGWSLVSILIAILVAGLPRGQAVAVKAEARGSPVRKVIDLLNAMSTKVREEGDEKAESYKKFECYCNHNKENLKAQNAEAEKTIPTLRSRLSEVTALNAELGAEIEGAKKDREDAKRVLKDAMAMRKKEYVAYTKESESKRQTLEALGKAIMALRKGNGALFLQTASAGLLRSLSLSADMTAHDRDMLSSFLANGNENGYQPASLGVLGMMKNMKEEMEADLKELQAEEKKRVEGHEALIAANQEEISASSKSIEEKMNRLSELAVELQQVKMNLQVEEHNAKQNAEFAFELKQQCKDEEEAWSQYQNNQAEELQALAETVSFLDSEEAQTSLRAATSHGLLQLSKQTTAAPAEDFPSTRPWLSFLQLGGSEPSKVAILSQAKRSLRASPKGLDLIELAIQGKGEGLDQVVEKIEDLIEELKEEGKNDQDQLRFCDSKLRKAEYEKKDKEKDLEDATTALETFQGELKNVMDEIKETGGILEDLDKQVDEATKARKEANDQFVQNQMTSQAALELLGKAEERLKRFYASFLQENATSAAETGELRSRQPEGMMKKPDVVGEYQKRDSSKLIFLFNTIKGDVERQKMTLENEDKLGQAEYEMFVSNANEKKRLYTKSLGASNAAKAEMEAQIQRCHAEMRSQEKMLASLKQEIFDLHQKCDFLVKNFDLRIDARASETQSLLRASGIISEAQRSINRDKQ